MVQISPLHACRLSGNMYTVSNSQLRSAAAQFPYVVSLNLSQCSTTDLSPLQQLRHLQVLELNGCCALPAKALQCLSALPQLSKLDLSGCTRAATDEGMRHVACGYLQCLCLSWTPPADGRGRFASHAESQAVCHVLLGCIGLQLN